jgi:protein AaeX
MNFTEVDLFGVYVAPISVMMVAAWLVLIALRRVADHYGCCGTSGTRRCSCSLAT